MNWLPSLTKPGLRLLATAGITAGLYACLSTQKTITQTAGVSSSAATVAPATPRRVLVFSKTKGWKHSSIPFGIAAVQKLGQEHSFRVDTTKNAAYFTDDSLRHYQAVVFMSTTGNVLNPVQQAAFERYIQAWGGYVGLHSATDC